MHLEVFALNVETQTSSVATSQALQEKLLYRIFEVWNVHCVSWFTFKPHSLLDILYYAHVTILSLI